MRDLQIDANAQHFVERAHASYEKILQYRSLAFIMRGIGEGHNVYSRRGICHYSAYHFYF